MFDLAAATAAVERDFGAIIDRLDSLADADWDRPVRCTGWQVKDLAVHVAGASRGQAEGLRRAAAGVTGLAVLDPPAERGPRDLLAALKGGRDGLLSALRALPEPALQGAVPLPFGLLPAPVALQIVPLEYGFHRNDLDWALGDLAPLSEDVSATLLGILPGLLPMLAAGSPVSGGGATPGTPVAYRLIAPSARVLASYAQGGWSIAPDDGHTAVACEISGGDSPMALFVMGRIDAGHPGVTTSDRGTAMAFKRYFPGP
jgi:uncharacterized protein (TIGR03083 family)